MATAEMQEVRAPRDPHTAGGECATPEEHQHEETQAMEVMVGGSVTEAIGGIAGVVLAILGLAGVLPLYLAAIATIAIGVALCVEGGALASTYEDVLDESGGREHALGVTGGMTVEVLGGLAGIVLGVLALLHLAPTTLLAIAAIAFGATLILGSGATARLRGLALPGHRMHHMAWRMAWESILGAAAGQTLAGIAAVVLGIVALANYLSPLSLTLILVAMLCLGASVLLSGSAVTGKVLSALRR